MNEAADLTRIAHLLADPARASMLWTLIDGTTRPAGELADLGVDLAAARSGRRAFARGCVDLTQRRLHLSGALAAALLDVYVRRGWVQRSARSRVVSITPKGRAGFRQWFAA